ncbi:MAG: divergent PAP2 family protein [Candidatus Margulisiibacteriota bacterium]
MHLQVTELFFELYPLTSALLAMLTAQLIKLIYFYIKEGKINLKLMFTAGGMPSSHSAMVMGLTTGVGLKEGWTSSLLCMCVVFSLVVLYDAAGIRQAVGKQAEILNQMMDDYVQKGEFKAVHLTELLGHTPLEVAAGSLLGIGVAFTLFY